MDHPDTETVTRYGVAIQDRVDGTPRYLTGFRPDSSCGWVAVFTSVCEDACTWGSEAKAKAAVASLKESVGFYGTTINVVPIEEPTYND
jgi:hypothetical protein